MTTKMRNAKPVGNGLPISWAAFLALSFAAGAGIAADRHAGTAIVRVADTEYTIPIECNDSSRPELGFSTEPSRITRQRTGRTSGVRLTVRPWKDTAELVITLDRYVAWVPTKASSGGVLSMTLNLSPSSVVKDGVPVTLTYERWSAGERARGLDSVSFEANCGVANEAAPTMRKVGGETL